MSSNAISNERRSSSLDMVLLEGRGVDILEEASEVGAVLVTLMSKVFRDDDEDAEIK